MKLKINLLLLILLIVPAVLVFKSLFISGHLSFGDAPFFYPENLNELFNKPLSWDFRNSNFGASQVQILWLYLPTFLMGFLNHLFNLNHDILIRLTFYFPSVILSFFGAWLFLREYIKDSRATLLGVLFYGLNNHFLLLIDGGQIGVALAYGLFPYVLVAFRNFLAKKNLKSFLLATLTFVLISNIDLRLALLSILTIIILSFAKAFLHKSTKEIISLKFLAVVVVISAILDVIWLVPLIFSPVEVAKSPNSLNLISLIDSLYIFNPHFPNNEFGQTTQIPFYFGLMPFLIFGGLIYAQSRTYLSLLLPLLMMIFLSKGGSEPLGGIYNFFLNSFPFASAFRDSTKFLVPVILISSTLIALNIQTIFSKFSTKKAMLFFIALYGYLLLLIHPALTGGLSGTLAVRLPNSNFTATYQSLQRQSGSFRTLWFPERPPLAFSTKGQEALSANLLYQDNPFASMILGDYDLFYFLHDEMLTDWFKLLGVRYVFFPEDERKKTWTFKERQERVMFLNFVDQIKGFNKLSWSTSFPGYEVKDTRPKIFFQKKALIVVGDSSIYHFLNNQMTNFNLSNQGFLFVEDGKLAVDSLLYLPKDSAFLVFKDRQRYDLTLSLLQNKFIDQKNFQTNWGIYQSSDFLKWRYELSKRSIETEDFTFGRGILFSSQKGEQIRAVMNVPRVDRYYLAVRNISTSDSAKLKITIANQEMELSPSINKFSWNIVGPFSLSQGQIEIKLINQGGFQAVNTIAFFDQQELDKAQARAELIHNHFQEFDLSNNENLQQLNTYLKSLNTSIVDYQEKDPTEYMIKISPAAGWLIFSDHYDRQWKMEQSNSFPIYSMINGFWIDETVPSFTIKYQTQKIVDKLLPVSVLGWSLFLIISFIAFVKRK